MSETVKQDNYETHVRIHPWTDEDFDIELIQAHIEYINNERKRSGTA